MGFCSGYADLRSFWLLRTHLKEEVLNVVRKVLATLRGYLKNPSVPYSGRLSARSQLAISSVRLAGQFHGLLMCLALSALF